MMTRLITRLKAADDGASIIEYALLVILIAIFAFTAVQLAGDTLSQTYSEIASDIANA